MASVDMRKNFQQGFRTATLEQMGYVRICSCGCILGCGSALHAVMDNCYVRNISQIIFRYKNDNILRMLNDGFNLESDD